ncbi:MAG: hypothetical protein AB7T22_06620 [Calditrichaceae bacterium]
MSRILCYGKYHRQIKKVMMMKIKFIFILILIAVPIFSQNLSREIGTLEEDLRQFSYERVLEKGNYLLSDSFISKDDSLTIFQYMLQAASSLNDTTQAREISEKILKCSPGFKLNPKIISPKIINFFEEYRNKKVNVKNEAPVETATFSGRPAFKAMLANIIIPGSGYFFTQNKTKGYIFSGISTIIIGGITYYSIHSSEYRDDYMNARGSIDFDHLYNRYNDAYKTRNTFILSYLILNFYSFYDFYTHGNDMTFSFDVKTKSNKSIVFQIQKRW